MTEFSSGATVPTTKARGAIMALAAALLWGVSGTCAQFLFQHRNVNTEWLVTARMLSAGLLMLAFARLQKQPVADVWKSRADTISLLLFSIFGILAVQYTYFAAIRAANAATATILQYLGPVLIVAYFAARNRKLPTRTETLALVFALAGTFCIVTHGSPQKLSLSGAALFWGLISAVALAYYTILPVGLLKRWNASVIIGWGMLIGGIAMSFVHPPWKISGHWDGASVALFVFIVLFGTLTAFYLFLTSVKILGATDASLLACVEPLSAAVIAVLWLRVPFGPLDWLGTALILATIFLLAVKQKPPKVY